MTRAQAVKQQLAPRSEQDKDGLWWLLQEMSTLSRRMADRQLATAGTSIDQVQALRSLAASQCLTIGELARAMGLERNSASQVAERLVQRQLVMRVRSTQDRRQVLLTLTEEGRDLLARAQQLTVGLASALLVDALPGELAAATEALSELRGRAADLLATTA